MDGADTWMIQGGGSLCFTVKAAHCLRVWREPVRKELQGNETVKLGVLSLVHNTHAAATELFQNAVVRNALADERVGIRHSAVILGCDLRQVNEGRQGRQLAT
jgi:hypothetical protein